MRGKSREVNTVGQGHNSVGYGISTTSVWAPVSDRAKIGPAKHFGLASLVRPATLLPTTNFPQHTIMADDDFDIPYVYSAMAFEECIR